MCDGVTAMKLNRQQLAKAIFGSPARLETAAWILTLPEDTALSLDEAAIAMSPLHKSELHRCLSQLVECEMLERDETVAGRPRYRRLPSPLWEGWRSFAHAFGELDETQSRAGGSASAGPPLRVLAQPGRI